MFEPQGVAKWHALPSIWHPLEGPGRVYDLYLLTSISTDRLETPTLQGRRLVAPSSWGALHDGAEPPYEPRTLGPGNPTPRLDHPGLVGWSCIRDVRYVRSTQGWWGRQFLEVFFIPRKTNSWIPQHIYGPWKKVTQFVEFLRCRFFR